jgi:hypothetical protein
MASITEFFDPFSEFNAQASFSPVRAAKTEKDHGVEVRLFALQAALDPELRRLFMSATRLSDLLDEACKRPDQIVASNAAARGDLRDLILVLNVIRAIANDENILLHVHANLNTVKAAVTGQYCRGDSQDPLAVDYTRKIVASILNVAERNMGLSALAPADVAEDPTVADLVRMARLAVVAANQLVDDLPRSIAFIRVALTEQQQAAAAAGNAVVSGILGRLAAASPVVFTHYRRALLCGTSDNVPPDAELVRLLQGGAAADAPASAGASAGGGAAAASAGAGAWIDTRAREGARAAAVALSLIHI